MSDEYHVHTLFLLPRVNFFITIVILCMYVDWPNWVTQKQNKNNILTACIHVENKIFPSGRVL